MIQDTPALLDAIRARFAHVDSCPFQGPRIFFENAGGALTLNSVVQTSAKFAALPDNPGRFNPAGQGLQDVINKAKADLAVFMNAPDGQFFAGESGTELLFRLIRTACVNAPKGAKVIGSSIEHPASRSAARRWAGIAGLAYVNVPHDDATGRVTPQDYAALMTPDVAVIGINTMTPWRWQRGWATRTQVRRAARLCRTGPAHRLNVIVAHHPFELPPDSDKSPMINGEWGLQILAEAGADVVLSGHLHRWHVIAPPGQATAEILQIHCGTGLSTRMRGEPNDFAMLDIGSPSSDSDLTVTRWIAGPDNSFTPRETTRFHRGPDGWRNPAEDADRPLQF